MKCPKCQFENPERVKFCGECGAKLERICTDCQFSNPPEFKFCGGCGKPLEEIQKLPLIDYSKPQSYTPKFLADKILNTRSSVEGERKLVTVLFADVAGYTSLSEKLDPEEVHQMMDGCFKILMDEIHKYEGTINQFTGDGVMALFGAPLAHEDHAQRACHAALSIQKSLGDYCEKVKNDCGQEFRMRIGLNSGPVVVGSIGDDLRMDYTAVGDTTNLAARMQSLATPGTVLITRNTQRLVKNFFEFHSLGKVEVKGKEEPQEAYELLRASKVGTRIEASVAKGLTRFVGRKNSMGVLMEAYEKAQSGSGQVVGIVGEAGVGKSRLLLEFRNRLDQDEFTYLEGRCVHFGEGMTYLPILSILRSYFQIEEGEREVLIRKKLKEKVLNLDERLQKVIPPFRELFSLKMEDETFSRLETKEKRERIFEGIRDLLIRESQKKLLIIAVEDLHWIDKTSEDFLDYFLGWLPNQKILLILLQRPEYTHNWGNKSYYTRLGVNQLTLQSSAELVQAILEGGGVAPELRDLILNRAAGNPLFMEELSHSLLENGSIQKKDNHFVLVRRPSDLEIPETIQGIIAARMDRLEENLKRIMQVASVIGREFAFRVLQGILEIKEGVKSQLLNLQGLEFIYEKSLFPELGYIFKHALTQEVAYNSLLLKRRREIHEKIGKAIEDLYPDRLEEFYEMLAYHYSKSDNLEKACPYLKLSGNKATRSHSLWEAYRYYQETISTLKQMPDTERNKKDQVEIILLMAGPIRLLAFPEGSLEILQAGEKLCQELEDKKSMARLNNFISQLYIDRGKPMPDSKNYEDSFEEAEKKKDIELMAIISHGLCVSYMAEGNYRELESKASKIISLLEQTNRVGEFFFPHLNTYVFLRGIYGQALGALGKFEEGEQSCKKALSFAHKTNNFFSIGIAEAHYAILYVFRGDGEKAVKHSQSCIEYFQKSNVLIYLPSSWGFLGCGYYFLGELNMALNIMERSIKMHMESGLRFWFPLPRVGLSLINFDLGNLNDARDQADQGVKLAEATKEKHFEGMSWIQLGRTIRKMEPPQLTRAEELIRRGIKILDELEVKPWFSVGHLFLGEVYADAGQKEKGLENLRKAETMFQEMGMDYWLGRTRKVLASIGV